MRISLIPAALSLALALTGIAGQAQARDALYHHTLKSGARGLPARILVLTPDVLIYEITAGGIVEKLPRRSADAVERFRKSLRRFGDSHTVPVEILPMPDLEPGEQEQVEDFVAQFMVVSSAVRAAQDGGAAWAHRITRFDYSVGFGLAFLKERSGAEAVLLSTGSALSESGGRTTVNLLGTVLGLALSGGGYASYRNDDRADLSLALVDLDTGDILWTRTDVRSPRVLDDDTANYEYVRDTIQGYFRNAVPAGGARHPTPP
jgi:hypothetical protein